MLFLQGFVGQGQAPRSQHPLDRIVHQFKIGGLQQKIGRTGLDGLDGRLHRTVGGQHHDIGQVIALPHGAHYLKPTDPRHFQIQEDQIVGL